MLHALLIVSIIIGPCAHAAADLVGLTLPELLPILGPPIIEPEMLTNGRQMAIYIDRKAQSAATDRKDFSIQRYGWQLFLLNNKVVEQYPVYGTVSAPVLEKSTNNDHIAVLYGVSTSHTTTQKALRIGVFQGGEYFYTMDSPSCSLRIRQLTILRDKMEPSSIVVKMRIDNESRNEFKVFKEQLSNLRIFLSIERHTISVGDAEVNELDETIDFRFNDAASVLASLRKVGFNDKS